MKKYLFITVGLAALCAATLRADVKPTYERFYGKITAVNANSQSLTVHNNKRKEDASFTWDDSTKISFKKKSMPSNELSVGQFLMVSYVIEDNMNRAKSILVRVPPTFAKKSTN